MFVKSKILAEEMFPHRSGVDGQSSFKKLKETTLPMRHAQAALLSSAFSFGLLAACFDLS
jgi:hypothetical protein